jgi:restriction system protein
MSIPKYDDLFTPLLQAMHNLGGSASIAEQEDEVAVILKLTDEDVAEIHKGNRTKLSYRLAWARNYLKRFGVLDNSSRGVWALTTEGQKHKKLNKNDVKKFVQALDRDERRETENGAEKLDVGSSELLNIGWEDRLLEVIKRMKPDAFERLCQRLLRESGFIQVEVTGKSSDGGIDGKGVVRIGGLLSFHVIFQCKRYQGSVSSPLVRDFRGAMVGRADKGLLITTGTFTKDARNEAQRDGAPPIDLIDGEALVEKLKELRIGVKVNEKIVEEVVIDEMYFDGV